LSLVYELRCFLLREKVLPPNHRNIGKNFAMMDECYEHLRQSKPALDYYRRALFIYEQCLTHSHHDRWSVENKIERLSAELENNQIEEVEL
jgi:hypothetical protein